MTAHDDLIEIMAEDNEEYGKVTQLMMKMWECREIMREVHEYALREASYPNVQDARETMDDWYATWGEMFGMLKVRSAILEDRVIRAGKLEEILSQNKTKVKK